MFQTLKGIISKVEKRLDEAKLEVKDQTKQVQQLVEDALPLSLSSAAVQPAVYREGVDLEAPALVLKYEAALQAIHNNNANLAAKAEKTDAQLGPAIARVQAECTAIENFRKELESIPAILSRIAAITSSIEDLQPKFELLESLLTLQIEQAMAQQTLRFKEQCTQELEKYRLQRQQELNALRNELEIQKWNSELAKQKQREEDIRRRQREEQQQIEQARLYLRQQEEQAKLAAKETEAKRLEYEQKLQRDLEEYKRQKAAELDPRPEILRPPPKELFLNDAAFSTLKTSRSSSSGPVSAATLEDVQLEQTDSGELNSFLADVSPTASSTATDVLSPRDSDDS